MILIADCGSTKIDWCLLNGQKIEARFETPGMNAVMTTREEMTQRIADEVKPNLPQGGIENVYFYGAGCVSPEVCGNVAEAIKRSVPEANVEVYTDLLAAARALCGRGPGIACILGTGSNSCYYDGAKIAKGVSPLGYILGDEGSGAVLGKILVGNVLKNQLPANLCEKFLNQYQLNAIDIITNVYRKPGGNRFLASLSPFILQNIERLEMYQMAREAFGAFFKRNVCQLAEASGIREANFVGSIAHYYEKVIREAAADYGISVGKILKSPMAGLIEYHTK